MPTYEYLCRDGHESEARQSIDAEPLEVCPRGDCDAEAERQISFGGGLVIGGGSRERGGSDCGPSGFT